MKMTPFPLRLAHRLTAFRRREDGAALVEFAISLPMILVVSYCAIDSMRLFWSYQAAVAGVRDATRYLARIAPADICGAGGSLVAYQAQLATIIDSIRHSENSTMMVGTVSRRMPAKERRRT